MKIVDLENVDIERTYMSILKEINGVIDSFGDNINNVVTNCNMASVLMDYSNFTLSPLKSSITDGGKKYPVGQLNNNIIYVDPLLKWTDNQIYLYLNDELIETIEIKDKNNILI